MAGTHTHKSSPLNETPVCICWSEL